MHKPISKILIGTFYILLTFSIFTAGYISNLKSGISDNVLRLHIVGSSNEQLDQNIKLKVRDRILKEFSGIFKECKNMNDALSCAENSLEKIEVVAEDELMLQGCNQKAQAELKKTSFPTKSYGNISLPSGKYTALNIKLGDAKGENWWCVMYPPLCITEDIISIPDSSQEKLKKVLSNEEYLLITNTKNIRFKIAEIIGKYIN